VHAKNTKLQNELKTASKSVSEVNTKVSNNEKSKASENQQNKLLKE